MKFTTALFSTLLSLSSLHGQDAQTQTIKIPVDSPAFAFSPGNWTGDEGRNGKLFRQSWNPGAYFRVTWETKSDNPTAKILFDTTSYSKKFAAPSIAYCIDGIWKAGIPCASEIPVEELAKPGRHELSVFLCSSTQTERWDGANVIKVTGLEIDGKGVPSAADKKSKWALIVGDSITEGCGGTALASYAHLLGQALQTQGYDYGISACGWSGWINKGDNPPGDVPGYYVVSNSVDGRGGQYDNAASRWDKIDGKNSLLDAKGHLSAYGQCGQEPALITINYGTNDLLHKSNPSDTAASIAQCLAALRSSAPDAQIIMIIPFGQYYAKQIKEAVRTHKENHPADTKIAIIDLGQNIARTFAKKGVMGDLHPNDKGYANMAALIIPQTIAILNASK